MILWVCNKYLKQDMTRLCGKDKTTDNYGSSLYKEL